MRLIKHVQERIRNEEGSSFIEVGIASIAMAVIVFLGIDAYVWMQAFMLNDIACRDACRAAAGAQGTTAALTKAAAERAAERECTLHSVTRPYIGNPTLVKGAGFIWNDFGASGGNPLPAQPQTPFVRVQTTMNVNLPVPLFMGNKMAGGALVFRRSYAMPIVKLPENP